MNTENYIAELKISVKENTANTSAELVEYVRDLLEVTSDSYLAAYENKNLEYMGELLNNQRKLRKEVTDVLRESQNQLLVMSAKFVQSYNMFNKILQIENEKKDLKNHLKVILKAHSYAEDILKYLYKNNFVKHKELADDLSIPKSTLTYTLNILEEIDCIEKIGDKKHASYSLSNLGRKYVVENLEKIDEVILDPARFSDESRQICNEKTQLMKNAKYMNDCKYIRAYGASVKQNKWESLKIKENIYE